MVAEILTPASAGRDIGWLRADLGLTQAEVARKAGFDPSRVSRIEKGEGIAAGDVLRILDALIDLGSEGAAHYRDFLRLRWRHVERPTFWNSEREYLEQAEETIGRIEAFLADNPETPWPLRRQLERHKDLLIQAADYLSSTAHQLAFIGKFGVGKSTAISYLFNLLLPSAKSQKPQDRVLLEAGGGGTTICEVRIRRGPDFGISILPQSDIEMGNLVSDFCAAKWLQIRGRDKDGDDVVRVGIEIERAIRNMSGLTTARERGRDGKTISRDRALELAEGCESEDEFRTKVFDRMHLADRVNREVWFDKSTGKHPHVWLAEMFKAINNGRVKDMPVPRSIDLLIPEFENGQRDLDVTIIDTKGIDDVTVREDLDARLRDPRTALVLCSYFYDAPGAAAQILLKHMRETFAERIDTGKVSILALPRTGEAMAVKDDAGEPPIDDQDGYELKKEQVNRSLGARELTGASIRFLNVETDDASAVRSQLLDQIGTLRRACADRILNLSAAIDDLIEKHETQAVSAAVEEVANRLRTFLAANRDLKARERHAYSEALSAVDETCYASTLWASTRRNGQYYGLNFVHRIGVGAARDAMLRCREWFEGLRMLLRSLKADEGLKLAEKTIEQIEHGVEASRGAFAEAVQIAGAEVYRDPLNSAANMWSSCEGEWGQGRGFKYRVRDHMETWFDKRSDLRDELERITNALWEEKVIRPIERLTEEGSDFEEQDPVPGIPLRIAGVQKAS